MRNSKWWPVFVNALNRYIHLKKWIEIAWKQKHIWNKSILRSETPTVWGIALMAIRFCILDFMSRAYRCTQFISYSLNATHTFSHLMSDEFWCCWLFQRENKNIDNKTELQTPTWNCHGRFLRISAAIVVWIIFIYKWRHILNFQWISTALISFIWSECRV